MKRNNFYKNTGRIILAIGLVATAMLSSCLKDTSPGALDLSKSPALLGFQYGGFGFQPYVAAIYGKSTDELDLKVTLSVPSITLGQAVTATLVSDPAFVASYNTANGTNYQELPAADWSLPNGGNITIPAGTQYLPVKISFAGQNIDFTKSYAFAVKITNSNGAIVASNLNEALVTITLKSIYAGTYHADGVRHHPTAGDFPFNYNVAMSTVDKTTITGNALADLGADLTIHINPDNTVTVSSVSQGDTQVTPGAVNKYDPATKTFTLHYFYRVSAPRVINETLVYVGP